MQSIKGLWSGASLPRENIYEPHQTIAIVDLGPGNEHTTSSEKDTVRKQYPSSMLELETLLLNFAGGKSHKRGHCQLRPISSPKINGSETKDLG